VLVYFVFNNWTRKGIYSSTCELFTGYIAGYPFFHFFVLDVLMFKYMLSIAQLLTITFTNFPTFRFGSHILSAPITVNCAEFGKRILPKPFRSSWSLRLFLRISFCSVIYSRGRFFAQFSLLGVCMCCSHWTIVIFFNTLYKR
jgi:hypothetical protein